MTIRRSLLRLILWAIPGLLAVPAVGQPPSTASTVVDADRLPLRYRWVKAPLDRRSEWPTGKTHYIPMDAANFRQMVDDVNATFDPAASSIGATIASATYRARLDGDALVDGQALLDVVYPGTTPTSLSLEPCGVALGEASWADQDGQAAQVGLDSNEKLTVRLTQPGQLQFDWSLRGRSDAQGTTTFAWELPPSPAIRLLIDLPEAMVPVPDQGIVARDPEDDGEMRRWRIELGGHHRFVLRVVPKGDAPDRRSPASVRQSVTYDFSPPGLNLSAKLKFNSYQKPLRQITLSLDPGLRVVTLKRETAGNDDSPVAWTELASASDDQPTRIVLDLLDPLGGAGNEVILAIGAVAPLKFGEPWRLPGIRSQGMLIEPTEATLRVAEPLRIDRLLPIEGRQSKPLQKQQFVPNSIRPPSGDEVREPQHGETFEVQYSGSDGGVEIVLARPEAPIKVDSGCTVELGSSEITARVVTTFEVSQGEQFRLEADVTRPWILDPIESIPPGMVADWHLDKQSGSTPRLVVRLSKPLSSSRPIRLLVTARRLRSTIGRRYGVDELVPLRFPATGGGKQLMWLRSVEPYQLVLEGDQRLHWVATQDLVASLLELFSALPGDVLFEKDARAAELRVSLETRKPDYAATVRIEATARETSLVERYVLRCDPKSGRVDRVLVRFSHPEEAEVHWELGTGDEVHPVQEPPTPDAESRAGETQPQGPWKDRQAWEIRLNPPRSEPFEIRATSVRDLTEGQMVDLVSLPEATNQQATVVVSFDWPTVARIENKGLTPIPTEAAPAGEYPTARATFHYDPFGGSAGEPPSLGIMPYDHQTVLPAAWVWSCRLESRYQPDGSGDHRATYRVQASGKRQLVLSLPPAVTEESIREVWVDDGPAKEVFTGHGLVVELPPKRKFSIVTICFTTLGPALARIDTLTPPLPVPDVVVLGQHWTVWLPPEYEALAAGSQVGQGPKAGSSLSERLFGPLGRAASRPPMDPFAPGEWSTIIGVESQRRSAAAKAAGLLQQIGERSSLASKVRSEDELDWGTLLAAEAIAGLLGDRSQNRPRLLLLIDPLALEETGLSPETPVRVIPRDKPGAQGAAILQNAGLAILVHSRAIMVTAAIQTGVYRSQLSPLDGQTMWWVRPGPLAEQIDEAVAGKPGAAFLPVAEWQKRPSPPQSPWQNAMRSGYRPPDTWGWTAYPVEIVAGEPAEITIIHRETFQSIRWIALLGTFALARWKLPRRAVTLTILAGTCAAAALFLPEVCRSAASGSLLGVLSALGFGLMCREPAGSRSKDETRRDSDNRRRQRTVIRVGTVLLAIAAVFAVCKASSGDQANEEPPRAYWVFVPVDEAENPTGDSYLVPEGFYQELHRRKANLTDPSDGWLISAAKYRGKLVWRFAPKRRLVLNQFEVTFDIEMFTPEARIRIPLAGVGASLSLDSAEFQGRTIQPQWQEEGGGWVFDVAASNRCSAQTPERYSLKLTLQPTPIRTEGPTAGFDLRIPRLAASRLRLSIPPDAPKIEVPRAVGSVTRVVDPPSLLVELGPNDRLGVRWQEGAARGVEELLWLTVRPSSVVLDARFTFHLGESFRGDLYFLVDPRLRRQGPYQRNGGSIEVADETPGRTPDQPRIVRLKLDQLTSPDVTIAASFKLAGTTGVGQIQLPLLSTHSTRIDRRWMAVSVDPLLNYEQQQREPLQAVAVNEFADAWGDAQREPSMAFDLASGEPQWRLTTTRREPKTTVRQITTVDYGPAEVRLSFQAQLATTDGDRVQYRLDLPPELTVDEVSVREGPLGDAENGVQRVARWASPFDGKMTVFLAAPVTAEHTLWLRGRLGPLPRGRPTSAGENEMPLPTIRVEGAELLSSKIELFRQPRVRVDLVDTNALVEIQSSPPDQNSEGSSRLVSRFEVVGSEPVAARVKISPNRPRMRAEQVTFLKQNGSSWNAKVDFSLEVRRGLVDEIRLSVPPAWSGPWEINPPMTVKLRSENGPHLVLRPRTAIEGEYRFSVSGPLSFAAGERVSVPEIVLDAAELRSHRLILPTQSQLQPVGWDIEGLRPIAMPKELLPPLVASESFVAYRVMGRSFRAAMRPLRAADAEVLLADVCLDWEPDGSCRGVAVFDLQAANLTECVIRMPLNCSLVEVAVAGIPVMPLADKGHGWRIPLGSKTLPQRIDVVFAGQQPPPSADFHRRFAAPTLDGLKVRRTLWTVSGPRSFQPPAAIDLPLVSASQQALIRLQNLARVIDLARDTGNENLLAWYPTWISRWAAATRELGRDLGEPDQDGRRGAVSAQLQSFILAEEEIARQLGTTDILQSALAEAEEAEGAIPLWHLTRSGAQAPARLDAAGSTGSITLLCRPAETDRVVDRLAESAGLVGSTLVVLLGIWAGVWSAVLRRWPHLVSVLAGLAWWLWLRPDYLGLLVVVCSAFAACRRGWKSSGQSSSAIIPLSVNRG